MRAKTSPPGKIPVENVNHPGAVRLVDASMYVAVRRAVLGALPSSAPGITLAELHERILPTLPTALFPGGAKAGWWLKTVQLDLEAKGTVIRTKSSPLRLSRTR